VVEFLIMTHNFLIYDVRFTMYDLCTKVKMYDLLI